MPPQKHTFLFNALIPGLEKTNDGMTSRARLLEGIRSQEEGMRHEGLRDDLEKGLDVAILLKLYLCSNLTRSLLSPLTLPRAVSECGVGGASK